LRETRKQLSERLREAAKRLQRLRETAKQLKRLRETGKNSVVREELS
jgi:hypothetical protein